MRINVYQEEVTGEVSLVTKADVIGADGQPVTFYGVRIWLEGSDKLHRTEHDDDRPAVTFWVGSHYDADKLRWTLAAAYRGADGAVDELGGIPASQLGEDRRRP